MVSLPFNQVQDLVLPHQRLVPRSGRTHVRTHYHNSSYTYRECVRLSCSPFPHAGARVFGSILAGVGLVTPGGCWAPAPGQPEGCPAPNTPASPEGLRTARLQVLRAAEPAPGAPSRRHRPPGPGRQPPLVLRPGRRLALAGLLPSAAHPPARPATGYRTGHGAAAPECPPHLRGSLREASRGFDPALRHDHAAEQTARGGSVAMPRDAAALKDRVALGSPSGWRVELFFRWLKQVLGLRPLGGSLQERRCRSRRRGAAACGARGGRARRPAGAPSSSSASTSPAGPGKRNCFTLAEDSKTPTRTTPHRNFRAEQSCSPKRRREQKESGVFSPLTDAISRDGRSPPLRFGEGFFPRTLHGATATGSAGSPIASPGGSASPSRALSKAAFSPRFHCSGV